MATPRSKPLDRTVPILPMQEGRIERRSHDYYRHGTSTLFAALDTPTGTLLSLAFTKRWVRGASR
jgi:hypothetical protein